MEPIPDPNDAKADLLTDPDPGTDPADPLPGDVREPNPTKDPGQFEDVGPIDDATDPIPATTVTVTAVPEPVSDDGGSDGLGTVVPWVLVVLLLAAVGALAIKAFGRGDRTAPAPVPAPVATSVPVAAPAPDLAASPAVPELITLADLITTPAAQTQVVRTLRTVGVEPVEATVGAPFNPDLHEAVATRPADNPDQINTIAVVHRAGWQSARGVVRPAGVEVWTADTGEGA